MQTFDLVIRGGTIVDGKRNPRFTGDVAIKDGTVVSMGKTHHRFLQTHDRRRRLIVAPGFVDLHTHYDAQIRWDPWCTISGWHGVTSVVLGNCGFGFAPVRPDFRERSMLTMTRTEAIPYASMEVGMPWEWETIPEYLDSLDRTPKGVNVHSVHAHRVVDDVRDGARSGENASGDGRRTQRDAAAAARRHGSGAVRLLDSAARAELGAGRLRRLADGHGHDGRRRHPRARRSAARTRRRFHPDHAGHRQHQGRPRVPRKARATANRPILHNVIAPARVDAEIHRRPMRWIEDCRQRGLPIYAQCATGRAGFAFTLDHWNLYDASPAWRAVTTGTHGEKLAKMQDPALRKALVDEAESADKRLRAIQAGIGGNPKGLIIQSVNGRRAP